MSTLVLVLLVLILLAVLGVGALVLRLLRNTRWYASVSVPWFNSIGQKIGLDNATHITEPPIKG